MLEHNDQGVLSVHVLTNTNPFQPKSQDDEKTNIKIRTFPLSVTGIHSYWDIVKLLRSPTEVKIRVFIGT